MALSFKRLPRQPLPNRVPSEGLDQRGHGVSVSELVYRRNETPRSTRDLLLYSAQWLITMFYAVVWGYAIVGAGLGFRGAPLTEYLAAVVLTVGLATLLQAWLGHRMAMVSGPNVIPSLAIIAAFRRPFPLSAFHSPAIHCFSKPEYSLALRRDCGTEAMIDLL
jgi:hypothetical protein